MPLGLNLILLNLPFVKTITSGILNKILLYRSDKQRYEILHDQKIHIFS